VLRIEDGPRRTFLDIIQVLGLVGLGIGIWELTKSVRIMLIYALLISNVIYALRHRMLSQRFGLLQQQMGSAEQDRGELQRFRGLFEGMLALFLYTTEQPQVDIKHHYTLIQEEYVIHKDDGMYNWVLRGRNTLNEPSAGVVLKLSGDSPSDLSSLSLAITDGITNQRFADGYLQVLNDLPYLKVFDIIFAKPIEKDEAFDLRVSCRWDNTFARSRRYDYVFFPWGQYAALGIDKSIGRLVSDVPISDFVLERLESGRLEKERAQPKLVDTSAHHFVLEWEVSNPRHVYILRFTKDIDGATAIG
jgi:hypothetical protein